MGGSVIARRVSRLLAPVAAVCCLTGCTSARQTSGSSTAPPRTVTVAQILAQIRNLAARNGEPNPTDIEFVTTTAAKAAKVTYGERPSAVAGEESVVLAAARGRFNGSGAKVPPGAAPPTGTVIVAIIDAASGELTDWGISKSFPDEATLGPVVKL
jgi:hypothetical protein